MSDEKKQPTEEQKPADAETTEAEAPQTDAAPAEAEAATAAEATEEATPEAEAEAGTETADDAVEVTEEERAAAQELPNRDLKPGMVVRVHETIKDMNTKGEERERVQIFEGTILGISGKGVGRTMTVRKVSKGFGVEKIYPLTSPHVAKVEVVKQFRTRRAKLGFLRRGKLKRRLREVKKA